MQDEKFELPETNRKASHRDRSPEHDPKPGIDMPLVDWIPASIHGLESPTHLEPFPTMLDKALSEPMRVLCSCPIRHWKSATVKAFVVKAMLMFPRMHIIVMTHTHSFANTYGRELRELHRSLGGAIRRGSDTILNWETDEGGSVYIMTNAQSALGRPCDIFIFDDPFSGEDEANKIDVRDHVDWVISQYTARLNPGGSVIGVMSRMHQDDAIGRRLSRKANDWVYIHKAALLDEGLPTERALAPAYWSVETLKAKREELYEQDASERTWYSQFQNDPREVARGLFKGVHEFSGEIPTDAMTVIGVDAAFSAEKSRDCFAAVVLREVGNTVVIVDAIRHQRGTLAMMQSLRELESKYPDAPMYAYTSGPEVGTYHHLAVSGIRVHQMNARWNKEYRARHCAAAWEAGLVQIIPGQAWTGPFLKEAFQFTGAVTGQDDQVDAMVAAFDAMKRGRAKNVIGICKGPYRT